MTTLRRDIKCDGRHAITEFTDDWQADASRRDLTFNALYYDINGKIYDYFGGIADLQNRKLCFIGNIEQRVCEDYLRILRVFRFHAQLECKKVDEEILDVCNKYAHMIQELSSERIRSELLKLLKFPLAIKTLAMMQDCNVLSKVMPLQLKLSDIENIEFISDDPLVNLAFILRANKIDVAVREIFKKWNLSKQQYRKLFMLYSVDFPITPQDQKSNIRKMGKELYLQGLLLSYYENKIGANEMKNYRDIAIKWDIPKFPLTGDDLISIGCKQGKEIKYYLQRALNYWEENNYSIAKKELMEYVKCVK